MNLGPLVLTDPHSAPTYGNGPLSRWCQRHLEDARDEVFVRLTLTAIPLQIALMGGLWFAVHRPHVPAWIPMAAYLALWGWLVPPMILMLHCTMHRPFVKVRALAKLHPYVVAFLFGMPTAYREHHTGMHHVEDNLGEDLSSTLRYRRDSFLDFLRYFSRFFFLIVIELPSYLRRRRRFQLARKALFGELAQYAVNIAAVVIDWRFGLAAFVMPWVLCRLMMMVGNWGQHAFINLERRNNGLSNAITCVNSGYNARCFNDGYHIGHHLRANMHWSEMPGELVANKEKYLANDAIVFKGLDFFAVSVLLWTNQYRTLARRFVRLGAPMTDDEVIALLKKRVQPVLDVPEGFARPLRGAKA
jgi:fatty acid desaturase